MEKQDQLDNNGSHVGYVANNFGVCWNQVGASIMEICEMPWWAWVVLGVGMLIVAAGLHKHPKRR